MRDDSMPTPKEVWEEIASTQSGYGKASDAKVQASVAHFLGSRVEELTQVLERVDMTQFDLANAQRAAVNQTALLVEAESKLVDVQNELVSAQRAGATEMANLTKAYVRATWAIAIATIALVVVGGLQVYVVVRSTPQAVSQGK